MTLALPAGSVGNQVTREILALDVFWPEPPPPDFPLLGLDNVILTPHLAARTYTAIENMSWVVRDVVEVLEGRPPKYPAPRR